MQCSCSSLAPSFSIGCCQSRSAKSQIQCLSRWQNTPGFNWKKFHWLALALLEHPHFAHSKPRYGPLCTCWHTLGQRIRPWSWWCISPLMLKWRYIIVNIGLFLPWSGVKVGAASIFILRLVIKLINVNTIEKRMYLFYLTYGFNRYSVTHPPGF